MDRREFLIGCSMALIAIPATMALNGCGGGGTTSSSGADFTVTSTGDQTGHAHTVTILSADLTAQPAAGVTYTTSSAGSTPHTHTLTITQAQLRDINSRQPESISTSTDLAHNHEFTIVKP